MELFLFFLIGGLTFIGSCMVIWQKNPINSALWLILTFMLMAALFLLLNAEFIAFIQVIVYAGAVMGLFLFVVMLINPQQSPRVWALDFGLAKLAGVILTFIVMPAIAIGITRGLAAPQGSKAVAAAKAAQAAAAGPSNTASVASLLFTDYLLPFEITSVLLFVAIAGAVYLAKREK